MKSIGLRLFFAFLSVVILVIGQGLLALHNAAWTLTIQEQNNQKNLKLNHFVQDFAAARFAVFEILGTFDPQLMDELNLKYRKLMLRLIDLSESIGLDKELLKEADRDYRKIIKYHYDYADKFAKNLLNGASLQQYKEVENLLEQLDRQLAIETEREIDNIRTSTLISSTAMTAAGVLIAVVWALVLMRSLIDRKKHEKALQKREKDLKKAQAMAKMGNWHFSYITGKTTWSEEMFKLYQMDHQEITSEVIKATIVEEDYTIFIGAMEEIEQSESIDITYRIKWPDGSIRYHHVEADLLRDEYGKAEGIFGISQDVTEDILTNENLNRLRNFLKSIVDSMPSILIGVDSNENITLLNKGAESHSIIPISSAKGQNVYQAFPFLLPKADVIKSVISNMIPRKDKKVVLKIDSERRYVDFTVFPLIEQSQEGAVIRIDDVTELVALEERMVQTEKMLSIGGLAAGMAHEINNPLAGILQNLQVLRNRLSPQMKKNRQVADKLDFDLKEMEKYVSERGLGKMLESAIESGKRAAQIVNNMLSFARKNTSTGQSSDLRELMDNTLELARNDYNLKKNYDFRKIKVTKHYADDVLKVYCEGPQIQQVFLNLLKNGAEAMNEIDYPDGVEPEITITIFNDGDLVTVLIKDNGPGMPEEVTKRIFEPFFTTKDVGKGTGLGLSVSYFIITENHKGTMSVESLRGEGTEFKIALPAIQQQIH